MKDKNNIITLSTVFILFSIFFWAKTGNMMIDFSREIYIPYQMQTGQVLVKDIFLIYGAFGYIANLIIYKFLTNINLLLLEAHIISYSIIILVYFILNKFFTKKASIFLSMLFMGVSVFSNSTFSFVLPYSYSNLWAVFGIYLSLFGILYNRKNILFLALGLILANQHLLFSLPKRKFQKKYNLYVYLPISTNTVFFSKQSKFKQLYIQLPLH